LNRKFRNACGSPSKKAGGVPRTTPYSVVTRCWPSSSSERVPLAGATPRTAWCAASVSHTKSEPTG
jgi:hypothetical protein